MNKRTIGIIAMIILLVGGFMFLTKPKSDTATSSSPPSNHIKGKGSTGITLIEYGDFQCSACAAYHPLVKNIITTYEDKIFVQFRNYPLEKLHQNARAGSRAAEAASLQGKFWEMHDALYENQKNWEGSSNPLDDYTAYAKQIGITDIAKFTADYRTSAVNDIINADVKEGSKYQITGTPTFILDGKKIENPRDQQSFNKLIDDAIAAKTKK